MDKKILGIAIGVGVIIAIIGGVLSISEEDTQQPILTKTNEKIGLVINTPSPSVSLQQVDQIFSDASSTGIGRSNVYLFWNIIEPQRGEFDWRQSDVIMGLNEKNDLKVTLYFSIINGETLGPFPNWIGKPSINAIGEDRLVDVLDAILSRYHIIDTVIIAGETESQFRHYEQNIPVYKEFFNGVYDKLKEKHPNVKLGNSFALHQVLNKDLGHIVNDLAIGDFVAFSYSPVDNLNDVIKSPNNYDDLERIFEIVPDKQIGIFEISWSTSEFVGGSENDQTDFIASIFPFFSDNESKIEFFTWYRMYDKPIGTCVTDTAEIDESKISVGGGSGMGSSEFVIERLDNYICNAGLLETSGIPKSGWNEFKRQIEKLN